MTNWGASYILMAEGRPLFFWEGCGLHLDTMAKETKMFFEQQGKKGIITQGCA